MILVTGGTGMLGSNLLLELTYDNSDIIALKRNSSSLSNVKKLFSRHNSSLNLKKIQWIDADLIDYYRLSDVFKEYGISKVYHCAAQISYKKSDNELLLENNVTSTKNIVDLSLQYKINKMCYVSSIATLGAGTDSNKITEKTEYNTDGNNSGYSISKYYAELEVWRGVAEGLNAVIINPSVILGSGDWKTGSSSIFSTINNGLKFYTKGITGFVDVIDVAKIMKLLMESEITAERFIINSENISYLELFKSIADKLNKKAPSIYANKYITAFAWRLEYVKSILIGSQPVITSNSARTSHKTLLYSNKKLLENIDYTFIKVEDSIKYYGEVFISDTNA